MADYAVVSDLDFRTRRSTSTRPRPVEGMADGVRLVCDVDGVLYTYGRAEMTARFGLSGELHPLQCQPRDHFDSRSGKSYKGAYGHLQQGRISAPRR
jgi:hypothetical protein